MTFDFHRLRRLTGPLAGLLVAGAFMAPLALAQQSAPTTVAVIDVQRILEESSAGKELKTELEALQKRKYAEAEVKTNDMKDLQARISEGRLSLSQERLEELRKELERKAIDLKRFEDDANRELNELSQERLGRIEARILPIINQVGSEFGYTLIFRKFESGLVFVKPEIDITDVILERLDAATSQNG
jgi:outer membrane protein